MQKQNEYTQTEEKLVQLLKRVRVFATKRPTLRNNPTAMLTTFGTFAIHKYIPNTQLKLWFLR